MHLISLTGFPLLHLTIKIIKYLTLTRCSVARVSCFADTAVVTLDVGAICILVTGIYTGALVDIFTDFSIPTETIETYTLLLLLLLLRNGPDKSSPKRQGPSG